MQLTIKHGLRQTERAYNSPPTVGEIKRDQELRDELGYGDNCRVLVGGVEQADFVVVTAATVTIETAANQKAIAT